MLATIASSVGLKMVAVAALLAAVGVFYWHYVGLKADRDAALAQVGALQAAVEIQMSTIGSLEGAVAEWAIQAEKFQKTLDSMAEAQVEANSHARRLNDVLSKHDLEKLALAKPGLIESRINIGTADVLGMFESATGGSSDGSGRGSPAGD